MLAVPSKATAVAEMSPVMSIVLAVANLVADAANVADVAVVAVVADVAVEADVAVVADVAVAALPVMLPTIGFVTVRLDRVPTLVIAG
tara:strand:+ start:303 stop:566 length:264 start_codon:yes stop_codon:yes gene_type:complete